MKLVELSGTKNGIAER